ncbi:MAG TPA: MYG1 family protein, partial [Candidatus Paceibacterota bacterium]|nr:MYG1 family protein [Candidatus Paceibacterota bacterium]
MTTIITHSGSFHPDDVFAVAALRLAHKEQDVNVIRTRDESVIAVGEWVVDVGGVHDPAAQRFDHHQPGAPVRENGIPYAAFGLVWQHIGT